MVGTWRSMRWSEGAVVRPRIGLLLASNSFALAVSQLSLKLDSINHPCQLFLSRMSRYNVALLSGGSYPN